jgi:hypothetical protein
MNRLIFPHPLFGRVPVFAVAALALLGLALPRPAAAQQPPQNQVPLKASLVGPLTPRFVIPLEPEIRLGTYTADGTADPLGPVKLVEANTLRLGPDGRLLSVTDGIGVLTAANGDALFLTYSGLVTSQAGSDATAEFAFTITGGRGRFLGATGSGVIHCATQSAQKQFTRVFEGTITSLKQ